MEIPHAITLEHRGDSNTLLGFRPSLVQTLPPRGKSAEIFPLIRGGRVFPAAMLRREKTRILPQENLRNLCRLQFAA